MMDYLLFLLTIIILPCIISKDKHEKNISVGKKEDNKNGYI